MRLTTMRGASVLLIAGLLLTEPAAAKCKDDAVQVGPICVDKYEASVWEIATSETQLIKKVQKGKIDSEADLAAATRRGRTGDDYGAECPNNAAACKNFYAVSIPGVTPSTAVTWFQASAMCRNAGKRLLTNAEWTMAAFGTPDPGTDNGTTDCNVTGGLPSMTGSRSSCVSDVGNFDMVGNVLEWVADWVEVAGGCTTMDPEYGNDATCSGGGVLVHFPGALYRGGDSLGGAGAGVFHASTNNGQTSQDPTGGFRCAR